MTPAPPEPQNAPAPHPEPATAYQEGYRDGWRAGWDERAAILRGLPRRHRDAAEAVA